MGGGRTSEEEEEEEEEEGESTTYSRPVLGTRPFFTSPLRPSSPFSRAVEWDKFRELEAERICVFFNVRSQLTASVFII